ncbi:autotransporter secretion outer membrane protein TamA [Fontimonas thermophila]|uniref:Translocation and assembly module subunit TamA n=1 Tax=Fontimonas thermophila TaxID=1076937 RepID=A0A1I2H553_9GAMM|nr:autotransporter assembly complex family protein [Fontimonas thermophila]SFF23906.1 autotransporter secretion outer membrane protein TamA [Fontimonas thermophila]
MPTCRLRIRLRVLGTAAVLAGLSAVAQAQIAVRIDGLDGELRDNAELHLTRLTETQEDLDSDLAEALLHDGFQDIRRALEPFGYYNPVMDGKLEGTAPRWTAHYRVDPGPRTHLDRVELRIEGEGAEQLAPVREAVLRRLREGAPLRHADYEAAKERLASAAYAAGFLDARFTQAELRVIADDNLAQVYLVFDTGPRYRFGAVTIEQDILDPDVLARYVRIRSGAIYDPQALLDTQFALGDLGYFETLDILPQREAATDHAVPIVIRTTPRKRARYDLGLGYGTDTGARVSAGTQIRRLNRAGHTAKAELRLSQIKNTAQAEYRIPLGRRVGESVGLSGELSEERLEDGDSRKWGLQLSLSRIPGDWQRRLYLAFTHEESRLGATRQTADLLTPGLSLNRAELDDPIYTRRGWSIFFDAHGAVRDVLANTSFLRTQVIVRGALPVGAHARLLGRYEYGANLVETFGELPASQRFFAGGDQSVRGYAYQSLGPTDAQGNVIGGKFLNTASIELERRIWRDWGAALFYDAGGADDDPAPRLFQGIGAGVRYRAPVGSVQVDVAHPLDGPDGGVRLHIGVRVGL